MTADATEQNAFMQTSYLSFFYTSKTFGEQNLHRKKMRKLRQNTQKIANFLCYYGKIHSKFPIFRVKSVKIYTGQKKIYTRILVAFVTNMRYGSGPRGLRNFGEILGNFGKF